MPPGDAYYLHTGDETIWLMSFTKRGRLITASVSKSIRQTRPLKLVGEGCKSDSDMIISTYWNKRVKTPPDFVLLENISDYVIAIYVVVNSAAKNARYKVPQLFSKF